MLPGDIGAHGTQLRAAAIVARKKLFTQRLESEEEEEVEAASGSSTAPLAVSSQIFSFCHRTALQSARSHSAEPPRSCAEEEETLQRRSR